MAALHEISTDTTAFPWANRTPGAGLQSCIAIGLALGLGHLAGHESAGAIAAGAAFTVGFAVFHEALASALLSMALVTAGIAAATLAGSLGAPWTPLVLVLVLVAAVNDGLLSGLGATTGWIGQQIATFIIIASAFPLGPHYALGRTAMVLVGGALQMVVYALASTIRHPKTEAAAPPLARRLHTRSVQLWKDFRAEAHLQTDTAGYTARLAVVLLVCTAVYRYLHLRNGYWLPMTALLVLKPQWSHTLSRGIARLAGTVVGATIGLLLARFVTLPEAIVFAMVVVWAWGCYSLQAVNYAAFSLCVTLYVVFLFRSGGFSQTSAAHIRLYNTALGGTIALAMDGTWKLISEARARKLPQPSRQPSA